MGGTFFGFHGAEHVGPLVEAIRPYPAVGRPKPHRQLEHELSDRALSEGQDGSAQDGDDYEEGIEEERHQAQAIDPAGEYSTKVPRALAIPSPVRR